MASQNLSVLHTGTMGFTGSGERIHSFALRLSKNIVTYMLFAECNSIFHLFFKDLHILQFISLLHTYYLLLKQPKHIRLS